MMIVWEKKEFFFEDFGVHSFKLAMAARKFLSWPRKENFFFLLFCSKFPGFLHRLTYNVKWVQILDFAINCSYGIYISTTSIKKFRDSNWQCNSSTDIWAKQTNLGNKDSAFGLWSVGAQCRCLWTIDPWVLQRGHSPASHPLSSKIRIGGKVLINLLCGNRWSTFFHQEISVGTDLCIHFAN